MLGDFIDAIRRYSTCEIVDANTVRFKVKHPYFEGVVTIEIHRASRLLKAMILSTCG